jgi:cytochrome c biogenesis protein CcmG/thiol:disulfide interchange protein DsbE
MKPRYVMLPLAAFVVLTAFLAVGLKHDPHEIPSPLIDKPAPTFRLPTLAAPEQRFGPADLKGKVWMLNVWASWCVSCREEHPVLLEFARGHEVPLVGLDYKDTDAEARKWLSQFGDPYSLVAVDADGRVGIDYGVYGVPETYVIDQRGVIVHKHIGPITPEVLETEIRPILKRLAS